RRPRSDRCRAPCRCRSRKVARARRRRERCARVPRTSPPCGAPRSTAGLASIRLCRRSSTSTSFSDLPMRFPAPALLVLVLSSSLAAQSARSRPFERLDDSGPLGRVTLAFDAEAFARLADGGPVFQLAGLPLPGGIELAPLLRATSALEPGANAEIVAAD